MIKRMVGMGIFLLIFLAVYGAFNYYIYVNIIQAIPLSGLLPLVQVMVLGLAIAYPAAQILKSRLPLPVISGLGALWMGFVSISVVVFAVKDLLSTVLPISLEAWSLALTIILTLWAAGKAWRGPGIKTVRIQHGKSRTLRIVHLSDLHLGALTSRRWLERVAAQVNSLEADVIVITGDLIDDSYRAVKKFVPVFRNLQARYGMYAVSGNHDHYQGMENFRTFCDSAGIRVADGQFFVVAEGVNILGLGGEVTRAGAEFAEKIRALLAAAREADYNILLLHHPVGFKISSKLGVDLQLCGHTHKGQLLPFNVLVRLVYRFAYGLHSLGDSQIYTSSGTGTWGPPLRLGSSSEIVRIEVNCTSEPA